MRLVFVSMMFHYTEYDYYPQRFWSPQQQNVVRKNLKVEPSQIRQYCRQASLTVSSTWNWLDWIDNAMSMSCILNRQACISCSCKTIDSGGQRETSGVLGAWPLNAVSNDWLKSHVIRVEEDIPAKYICYTIISMLFIAAQIASFTAYL